MRQVAEALRTVLALGMLNTSSKFMTAPSPLSADASDAPHLECPVEQLTGRAFDCSAKDVDDRTAELLEVWQLGLVLRDACAAKEDDVASVASYKKVVGNRRTVNDEAHW